MIIGCLKDLHFFLTYFCYRKILPTFEKIMLELNNLSVTGFEPSRLRTKLSHEKSKMLISYSSYQKAFWNGVVDFQVLALPV